MKIKAYLLAVLAIAWCTGGTACSHSDHDHDHESHVTDHDDHDGHEHLHDADEHNHDHDHEGHDHDGHDHDGNADDEIKLSAERAEKLGVKVDTLRLQTINEVITVTGEVIPDPSSQGVIVAPVSGRVSFTSSIKEGATVGKGSTVARISGADFNGGDANKAAALNLELAKKELDRLTPLREEGLVTVQEYNNALQAYQMARNAIGANGGNAISPISGVITQVDVANGQYVEAGTPIASVSANGKLTVRADVPKRYATLAATARTATVRLPYTDRTLQATLASQPSEAAATSAYQPIYFNVQASNALSPGSYVEVFLNVGTSKPGIMVPLTSITERLGQKFVYVQLDDDCYERRPVTIGTTDGKNVEITSGVAAGDVVVTNGTTFVRLAESANVAPPGHSHSH